MTARASSVPGFQIAFLAFAWVLLNAPLDAFVYGKWQWARDLGLDLGRALMVLSGGLVLLAVPALRRRCAEMLAPTIPEGRRREVALGMAMDWLVALGAIGVFVLVNYADGGEPGLARHMGERTPHDVAMQNALHPSAIVSLCVAALIAPIVEELVFRGFLFRAWEAAWGWAWAGFASSVVFGLFHHVTVLPQFLAGLVFVVVMRRAATLRASIYVHASFNLLAWYPLLGQWIFPPGRSSGELHVWTVHLVCLAVAIVALPLYIGSARDANVAREP
jgi:membrane protease YdiL (CAAX protease family)